VLGLECLIVPKHGRKSENWLKKARRRSPDVRAQAENGRVKDHDLQGIRDDMHCPGARASGTALPDAGRQLGGRKRPARRGHGRVPCAQVPGSGDRAGECGLGDGPPQNALHKLLLVRKGPDRGRDCGLPRRGVPQGTARRGDGNGVHVLQRGLPPAQAHAPDREDGSRVVRQGRPAGDLLRRLAHPHRLGEGTGHVPGGRALLGQGLHLQLPGVPRGDARAHPPPAPGGRSPDLSGVRDRGLHQGQGHVPEGQPHHFARDQDGRQARLGVLTNLPESGTNKR